MKNLKLKIFIIGLSLITMLLWTGLNAQASGVNKDRIQYNRNYHRVRTMYRTNYGFYRQIFKSGMKRSSSAKGSYNRKFAIMRIAKNGHGVFFKTNRGWINRDAFYKWTRYQGKLNYSMKVNHAHVLLYNKPWGLKGAKITGSTSTKKLVGNWYHVDKRAELNTGRGYYRLTTKNKTYWIKGKYLSFNTKKLVGNIKRIEKAVKVGSKLVGKSKYSWGGGRTAVSIRNRRFDCSSFIHYIYARSGVRLGALSGCTTYSLIHMGRKIKAKHMKRGDIFFFNDKDEGNNCHVAMYLGNRLFIHDSPSSDTGGVGISSLQDPHWKMRFNGIVRRLVG